MKRILMLAHEFPPFRGGIGTYVYELAQAAHRIGHEVTVVAPNYGDPFSFREDRKNYPFHVERFNGGVFENTNVVSLLRRLWVWTKKDKFDIVHATDWPDLLGLAFLNRFRTLRFLATVHGTEIRGSRHYTLPKVLLMKNAFEIPHRIALQSAFVKNLLLQTFPKVNPEHILMTYPGVASHWFDNDPNSKDVRQIYKIPEDKKIILSVSRLESRKGHRVAINAMKMLPESIKSEMVYVIVGKSRTHEYLLELKELASRFKLNVIFTGELSVEFLNSFYKTASIFCMPGEPHPTRVEGFGYAYLEAAAHGLPAIATKINAIPEVVLHDKTGLLVPIHDPAALSQCIEKLLTSPDLCRQLGENAKAWAQTFTWERCANQTYDDNW